MQVAAAIVKVTDTLPVGTDGFGTVAQCVVAVMPDVASGCAVQTVVAVFPDKVAEFVVEVLVAATLVHYAKGRLKTRYDFRRPFYRFVSILLLKLFQFFFAETDFTFVFAFE